MIYEPRHGTFAGGAVGCELQGTCGRRTLMNLTGLPCYDSRHAAEVSDV